MKQNNKAQYTTLLANKWNEGNFDGGGGGGVNITYISETG